MRGTYRALLRGDHIEWMGMPPDLPTEDRPAPILVMLLEEEGKPNHSGQSMADALTQISQLPLREDVVDPGLWERQIRQDRPLPDREI